MYNAHIRARYTKSAQNYKKVFIYARKKRKICIFEKFIVPLQPIYGRRITKKASRNVSPVDLHDNCHYRLGYIAIAEDVLFSGR